jgi:hypothetical protein
LGENSVGEADADEEEKSDKRDRADVEIKTDGKNKSEGEDNIKRNTEFRQGQDASYEEYVRSYVPC